MLRFGRLHCAVYYNTSFSFLLPLCPARDLGLFGRGGQALKHSLLSQHVLNRAELGGI